MERMERGPDVPCSARPSRAVWNIVCPGHGRWFHRFHRAPPLLSMAHTYRPGMEHRAWNIRACSPLLPALLAQGPAAVPVPHAGRATPGARPHLVRGRHQRPHPVAPGAAPDEVADHRNSLLAAYQDVPLMSVTLTDCSVSVEICPSSAIGDGGQATPARVGIFVGTGLGCACGRSAPVGKRAAWRARRRV